MQSMVKAVFVSCLLMVALAGCSSPLDDAVEAYERGDYQTAIQLVRPLANEGDADAQFDLGVLYMRGLGVPQDDSEAVRWYRKAADQGKMEAQTNLGLMYAEGRGVMQDNAEAVKWYRLAAEEGDPDAQHNLGLAYEQGEGVAQDHIQAHMWYSLAASRYSASDQRRREGPQKEYRNDSIDRRDELAAKMTPAQIAQAQKLAREWSSKTRRP